MAKPKARYWLKLWLKSVDNDLYFAEPFDKWHAWEDLLLQADQEGKLKTSLKCLKIRWSWSSIKRVRAYLGTLKGKGQITIKGTPSGTTITIVNWAKYQTDKSKKGKPKTDQKGTPKGTQEDIYTEEGVTSQSQSHPSLDNNKYNNKLSLEELGEIDFDD